MDQALQSGFGQSPDIRRLATLCPDPWPFEPKTFDRFFWGLLLCQVSSHSDQGFLFYCANIQTHSVTKWSQYLRSLLRGRRCC